MGAPAEAADRLLTSDEVADFLGVHPNTVYKMTARDELPSCKVGRARRYFLSDIVAMLRAQPGAAPLSA